MKDINGFPNGMCIDENGNLWVAVFGESKVFQIQMTSPQEYYY